jgi:hypothetical protein
LDTLRKAHVIRIQNASGGQDLADGTPSDQVASSDDIWLDVMRIDEAMITMPNAKSGLNQNVLHKLKWDDAPGDHQNTARKLKTVKITNPNDDSQWVKVDIIERATITHPNAKSGPNQNFRHVFKNDRDTNNFRKVDKATVYHTDVSGVDMTKGPVDWFKDYKPALIAGVQDRSQSLDVEIPKRFTLTKPNAQSGPPTQNWRYVVKNQAVEDAINQKTSSS